MQIPYTVAAILLAMTFKGYLKKKDWLIRVSVNDAGSYQIEYSNDGFMTKEMRTYGDRYKFLQAMELKFLPEELKKVL